MKRKWIHQGYYAFVALVILVIAGGILYIVRAGGGTLPVTGQAPDFTANSITGDPFSLRAQQGKIVLITWFYTHCTDECPLTMYRFEQIQRQLEQAGTFHRKVVLVAMTLDPSRDTVPVMRQYAAHFHANLNGWYFVRTSPTQTLEILGNWGIKANSNTDKEFIEHTSKTVLLDQNGNIRATYDTANLNPSQVMSNVNSLVTRMSWSS